jgi:hypothetical protein
MMRSFFEIIDFADFLPKWLQTIDYIVSFNGKLSGYGVGPGHTHTLKEFDNLEKNCLLVITFWDDHGGKAYEFDILDPEDQEDVKRLAEDFENSKGTSDQYDLALIDKEGNVFELKSKRIITVEEPVIARSKRFD